QGTSIYTAVGGGVTLSTQTDQLRLLGPPVDQLVLFNRMVLQDAYSYPSPSDPTVIISDLAKTVAGDTEGALGTVVVSLSNPSSYPVKLDWRSDSALTSQGLPAIDSAIATGPYQNFTLTSGSVTFPPGQTAQMITVQTLANNYHEGDTQFWIDLFNPQYGT